jgi:hypothetical protein
MVASPKKETSYTTTLALDWAGLNAHNLTL